MKRIYRLLRAASLVIVLYLAIVLFHGTITDFQPVEKSVLEPAQRSDRELIPDTTISFLIWNIGYAGLGEDANFFYDGGNMWVAGSKMVHPGPEKTARYFDGIQKTIGSIQSDFFLLQETDYESTRSQGVNQFENIGSLMPAYSAYFSVNYLAPRVPIPVFEPWRAYGKVHSGLATYAAYQPLESMRLQLPGEYGWPIKIFQLDRCVAVHRFSTVRNRQLVVCNIHNSAFDKGGQLKAQQMEYLRTFFLHEFEKGNFVIAGGDWNQCPPYFKTASLNPGQKTPYQPINIDPGLMPHDWRWIYDARTPTNRSVSKAYLKGQTPVTVIDFFLVSPNVRVLNAKTINTEFRFSDHQPVWMEVQLEL